ncbi:site-specific integrase [Dyadobacter sp. CY356]|uniref:site-specific integrase n=1 Tax=Dyadobacter sp. CY356 TaxID=2906442 RepID=UPI001F1B56D4|nr:site-specific integrase [Dyadobacter sp. CY356]MCF0055560.1 site-specific integrase [Dyadobacter sp. CY356]
MATTIKVVIRNAAKADGTFPLALRITKDRKSSYIHIGTSINEEDWDAVACKVKKTHRNSVRLNNLIAQKFAEASDTSLELQAKKKDVSAKLVAKKIKPKKGVTFFAIAAEFIENMRKEGKYNRVPTDQARINNFEAFLGTKDIDFSEITVPLLNRFRAHLKGDKKLSERTIVNHLILIRSLYNQAILGELADIKAYPFGRGKIQIKIPKSSKIGLTKEEVEAIEKLNLSVEPKLNHARNVFLFSYYFAGVRVSDVLRMKWTDFQNDRLFYSMGKNDKPGSLKIPEKVKAILDQYRGDDPVNGLIFPELKVVEDMSDQFTVERKISYGVKNLNKYLKLVAEKAKITKPMTNHISRHTFGNISGDKITPQMLQKLYRHSSLTTTISYQNNFIHKTADDALDAVLNG